MIANKKNESISSTFKFRESANKVHVLPTTNCKVQKVKEKNLRKRKKNTSIYNREKWVE